MSFKKTNRTLHKWGSIIIAIPLIVIFTTGILLLVKKEFSIIQPPTMKGQLKIPSIAFEDILSIAKNVKGAAISDWQDIDRLDVRPSKGVIKIRSYNRIEIQIDASSGKILHVAERNSDFIESIHDGTFFEKNANIWLSLPVAIISIIMVVTGTVLFLLPYFRKSKRFKPH
jgi:uncharacterized iron-regulated membrane protein